MQQKLLHSAIAAAALALTAVGAQAQDGFAALSKDIKATPMTGAQMSQVEGKAHVYKLVESKEVELKGRSFDATSLIAAPTPPTDDFTRSPSRDAEAFVRLLGS